MTELRIDGKPSDLPQVRRWVVRACSQDGCPQVDPDLVELLTSEVVGNAVRHGEGPVRLQVQCLPDAVRISVVDTGSGVPRTRHVDVDATSGRGMAIVEALARAWGHTRIPPPEEGKAVWFELHPG